MIHETAYNVSLKYTKSKRHNDTVRFCYNCIERCLSSWCNIQLMPVLRCLTVLNVIQTLNSVPTTNDRIAESDQLFKKNN